MAGRIRKDDIEALRERADIAVVVGDHTNLKRAGQRLKGLCPFHQEKTPSFTVDGGRGYYHCFGCGEGGDVYDFLQKVEGLTFTEAVEQLARRTGYTLRYEEMTAGEKRLLGERSRIVAANAAALAFFRAQLYTDEGAVARGYLKERGFGRDEADRFQIGYAPNDWEVMARALNGEGFGDQELVKAGLAVRNDRGGVRDRFRGRVLFPVLDLSGDVIGFGGRVLPGLDYGDFDPPKYLNTSETPVYRKTRVLYGMSWARPEIVRSQQVLICEGYTDVMALHQAGLTNAVATCGTAVTAEHFTLLSRYADEVVLAFDADEAGGKAAERAWELSRVHDVEVKVLVLPVGRDPADVVADHGPDALRDLVAAATPVIPFVLERRLAEHDLDSPEGRSRAVHAGEELLRLVPDEVLRREYARRLADATRVPLREVLSRVGGGTSTARPTPTPPPARRPASPPAPGGQRDSASDAARLERQALVLALQHPELLPDAWFELEEDDFSHRRARAVYRTLSAAGGAGTALDAVLAEAPDDDLRKLIREMALGEVPVQPDGAHVRGVVNRLLVRRLDAELAWVRDESDRVNWNVDRDRGVELARRHDELLARRTELLREE